jgi:CYTH domain-containing protein
MEIERKFTVNIEKWAEVIKPQPISIAQSYLSSSPECTVRVRLKGEKAYLTIKGKTNGISRSEFEYEVPIDEAIEMMNTLSSKTLYKKRYEINVGNHLWEVDVFEGKLAGLIIAEIELTSEDEVFELPEWVIEDVSHDAQYYNSNLIERL